VPLAGSKHAYPQICEPTTIGINSAKTKTTTSAKSKGALHHAWKAKCLTTGCMEAARHELHTEEKKKKGAPCALYTQKQHLISHAAAA
jgi:hypothetical protein